MNKFTSTGIVSDEAEPAIAGTHGYLPLYVVLFSGGRTSAFLAKYMKENPKYKDVIFVFMNTGKEREETLKFADRCDREFGLNLIWLEAVINYGSGNGTTHKIVDFATASRKGEPFTAMLGKYYLPNNRAGMNCTRELKQRPIDSYLRENFKGREIIRAVGIRYDERHRKSVNAEVEKFIYPLCDEMPVDTKFIRSWWSRQPFDLELKDYQGNCDLCFKKSLKKRLTIIAENPKCAEWWDNAEREFGSDESPRFDMRTNLTVSEQMEMAKRPFSKAIDFADKVHPELFEFETDCFCKAT